MNDVTYSTAYSFEELKDIYNEWDKFVVDVGSTIYMSYDWCRIWWDYYGLGRELRILTFFYDNELIGILPMYIDCLKIGPIKLRVAKLIGANIPPKIFNPPILEKWADSIFKLFLNILIKEENCDVISFGPISEVYAPIKNLMSVCERQSDIIGSVSMNCLGKHSFFYLPKTFDEYLKFLNKKECKKVKYELRYLDKSFDINVDVISKCDDQIEKEFENFKNLHTLQWNNAGRPGHFLAWPKADEFNMSITKAFCRRGNLRLNRLIANKSVVSYQYTFVFGDCYYWQLPARVVGSQWKRFNLGRTGLINMLKLAIDEGIRKVEGGLGHYEYKVRLGAKEYSAMNIRIIRNRLGSKIRSNIFHFLFCLVNILYHKIWYQRIQPHLPTFFQRPIWKIWIRMS